MGPLYCDIGNSAITYLLPSGKGKPERPERVASHPQDEADWSAAFSASLPSLEAVVVASVNPPAAGRFERWWRETAPRVPWALAGKDFPVPVENRTRHKQEAGMDRLLNVLAAHERVKRSAIVVDLGTATTFDLVSDDGAYLGGAIAPGLSLCFKSLHEFTALLPRVAAQEPAEPFGKDTASCMTIGVVEGYRGLVRHLVERFRKELGPDAPVLLTGGEARWAAAAVPDARVVPELTLDGLRLAYERWVRSTLPRRKEAQ